MNRTCEELSSQLEDYLGDQLNDEEKSRFENDLTKCPALQQEIKEFSTLNEHLAEHEGLRMPETVNDHFYQFLEEQEDTTTPARGWWWQVAAGLALLLTGGFIGSTITGDEQDISNIIALQQDVRYMKQLLVTAMLEEQSANDRIKAVSLTEDIQEPDFAIVKVLVNALNTDKSPNVRIAAANALEKWQNSEYVRSELVNAMEFQNNPIVQITLINMLINMGEKSAIKPFRKIAEDEKVEQLVREQAQIGIEVLI